MRLPAVVVLVLLALAPTQALADRHGMECFLARADDKDDNNDEKQYRLASGSCAGFLGGTVGTVSTGGTETSGNGYGGGHGPQFVGLLQQYLANEREVLLGVHYGGGHGKFQPYMRVLGGWIQSTATGSNTKDPAAAVGGGFELQAVNPCLPQMPKCGAAGVVRVELQGVILGGDAARAFPRLTFGFGVRYLHREYQEQ
jgi:hypothetical protein